MKTTINLDDRLLSKAKAAAAASGSTLTHFIEDALRAQLIGPVKERQPYRISLTTVAGDRPPNVDISDREALNDVIEQP